MESWSGTIIEGPEPGQSPSWDTGQKTCGALQLLPSPGGTQKHKTGAMLKTRFPNATFSYFMEILPKAPETQVHSRSNPVTLAPSISEVTAHGEFPQSKPHDCGRARACLPRMKGTGPLQGRGASGAERGPRASSPRRSCSGEPRHLQLTPGPPPSPHQLPPHELSSKPSGSSHVAYTSGSMLSHWNP